MLKYIAILGISILAVHYVATFNFLYYRFRWLDIPMHVLSGLWIGFIVAYVYGEKARVLDLKSNFSVTFLLVLGGALLVGVFWEFYEFFASQLLPRIIPAFDIGHMELGDTLMDILDDALGGFVAAMVIFFAGRLSGGKRIF